MTALTDYGSSTYTKLLLEGDAKVGKTTSLVALVENFKLRIWDYDSGLGPLIKECQNRKLPLDNIQYISLRDKYTSSQFGPMISGAPTAFADGLKACDQWPDDKSKPERWGTDYIAVFDSLTHLSNAAWNWSKFMHGSSSMVEGAPKKGEADPRAVTYTAQKGIEHMLAMLTAESFCTNVIVISHIKYGPAKAYPNSLGTALGPVILTYFNNHVLSFERTGRAETERRIIRTKSTDMLDLLTSAKVNDTVDAYDGLSLFFKR